MSERHERIDRWRRQQLQRVASRVRPETEISEELAWSDLVGHAVSYGGAVLRGTALRLRAPGSGGPVLCERDVQVLGSRNVHFGRGVLLERGVTILARGGAVDLADRVVIGRYSIIEVASGVRETGGRVVIGTNSALGDFCYVGGAGNVTIGVGVLVGQYVSFHAESHRHDDLHLAIREQGVTRQGITIEDDCWIGAGARILDGVTVARGTVVGAGAVVARSTERGDVVVGVPARPIRARSPGGER